MTFRHCSCFADVTATSAAQVNCRRLRPMRGGAGARSRWWRRRACLSASCARRRAARFIDT
eukprot:4960647-Pleurochrysis_carterae.AAC.6